MVGPLIATDVPASFLRSKIGAQQTESACATKDLARAGKVSFFCGDDFCAGLLPKAQASLDARLGNHSQSPPNKNARKNPPDPSSSPIAENGGASHRL
jgi:hypothetical protein